jgi:hypothetical protein
VTTIFEKMREWFRPRSAAEHLEAFEAEFEAAVARLSDLREQRRQYGFVLTLKIGREAVDREAADLDRDIAQIEQRIARLREQIGEARTAAARERQARYDAMLPIYLAHEAERRRQVAHVIDRRVAELRELIAHLCRLGAVGVYLGPHAKRCFDAAATVERLREAFGDPFDTTKPEPDCPSLAELELEVIDGLLRIFPDIERARQAQRRLAARGEELKLVPRQGGGFELVPLLTTSNLEQKDRAF